MKSSTTFDESRSRIGEKMRRNSVQVGEIEADPVGTYLVNSLNSGQVPGFSPQWVPRHEKNASSSSSFENEIEQTSIFPLFSSNNLRRLQHFLTSFVNLKTSLASKKDKETPLKQQKWNPYNRNHVPPNSTLPLRETIISVSAFLIILLLASSLCLKVVVEYTIKVYIKATAYLLSIFIDQDDFLAMCPEFLLKTCKFLQNFFVFVDDNLLWGKEFRGRHWSYDVSEKTKNLDKIRLQKRIAPPELDRFIMKDVNKDERTDNESKTLEKDKKSPDESSVFQRVDWEKMELKLNDDVRKGERKQGSLNHVVAMNFCFIMMKGINELEKDKSKKKKDKLSRGRKFRKKVSSKNSVMEKQSRPGFEEIFTSSFSNLNEEVSRNDDEILVIPSLSMDGSDDEPEERAMIVQSYSVDGYKNEYNQNDETIGPHEAFEIVGESHLDSYGLHSRQESFQSRPRCRSESDVSLSPKKTSERVNRDAKWLGFGAKLGMTILNSEHIQNVIQNSTDDQSEDDHLKEHTFDSLIQMDIGLTPTTSNINESNGFNLQKSTTTPRINESKGNINEK